MILVLTLKVVEYYDLWLKEVKRVVLMEKDGELYDASGLFSKLQDFEINNMQGVKVLHQEEVNYSDTSIEEQEEFLMGIEKLEKQYGIQDFGGMKAKHYWIYANGVSHICSYQ